MNYSCVVLMSTYNGERYVGEQIDSIINQDEVDVYLLIRDDGSSDNTISVLKEKVCKNPNQILLIEGANVGIHQSFADLMNSNMGDAEFVAFADQDDVWDSNKLSTAITQLLLNKADFYSSASRLVDSNMNDLHATTSNSKLHNYYINSVSSVLSPGSQGCTIVVTRSFFDSLREHGIPSYYGHDTWITVVAYYLNKSIYDADAHMSYRQHNQSWTGNRKNKFAQQRREFKFFIKGMKRYSMLSNDLLTKYNKEFEGEKRRVLELLSKPHKSMNDRINLILTKDFGKYGFVQNCIFKLFVLLGKV